MAVNTKSQGDIKPYSVPHILNQSFDENSQLLVVETVGYDGSSWQRVVNGAAMAMKATVSGSITYMAVAAPGTAQATAAWQVCKIDETTGTIITWADGNANFDNVATDLTSLSYS